MQQTNTHEEETHTAQPLQKEKTTCLTAAWWDREKRGKKSNARKMSHTKTEAIGHILSA